MLSRYVKFIHHGIELEVHISSNFAVQNWIISSFEMKGIYFEKQVGFLS